MIGKLKKKFTILATTSMFLLMSVLLLIMNAVNYNSVISESDMVLDMISQPEIPKLFDADPPEKPDKEFDTIIPRGMSPEVPYESRFFVATISKQGIVEESNLSRIVSVDENSVKEYIDEAISSKTERGFAKQFRYVKITDEGTTRIVFLDCGRKLDSFKRFLWTSVTVGVFGCLSVFLLFLFASGRFVKPIAESYDKQKRFISDAGHEIKTPLTIINANVDLLECDGEQEELNEIKAQTSRLTDLTNNLIYLSKMEETEQTIQMSETNLSETVNDVVNSFRAPTSAIGINIETDITPYLLMSGNPDELHRLVTILLDNALKYSSENGTITVSLLFTKRSAILKVHNTTNVLVNEADLPNIFDRFYRTDTSRNSETGGHGIGLSIAKAITEIHNGNISASTSNHNDFLITVTFPCLNK